MSYVRSYFLLNSLLLLMERRSSWLKSLLLYKKKIPPFIQVSPPPSNLNPMVTSEVRLDGQHVLTDRELG